MWFVITSEITEINIAVNERVGMSSPDVEKGKFRIVFGTALMAVQQTASLKKAGSLYGNRFQNNSPKTIT